MFLLDVIFHGILSPRSVLSSQEKTLSASVAAYELSVQ
jgi:hypothetical protein